MSRDVVSAAGRSLGSEASIAERTIERTYARLGWRLIPAFAGVSAVVLPVAGLAVNYGGIVGYLDGSLEQFWTGVTIITALALPGAVVALVVSWRRWTPVVVWLRVRDRASIDAEEAWRTAVLFPVRVFTALLAFFFISGAAYIVLYVQPEFDLGFWESVAMLCGGLSGAIGAWAALVFFADFTLKPLVADIARALPAEWRAPPTRWSVRAKAMTALPALALGIAVGASAPVPAGTSPATRMGITIAGALAVTLLVGIPLILMVTEAIQQPLRTLRAGTGRVARGDYSESIPPTTADEFGEVVESFNQMQGGLVERERLAGEKVELLGEIRASRARIVSASDAERRRVERNLHDGAQQRLVAVALQLQLLEERAASDPELRAMADRAKTELKGALDDLRELARGLHPQVLSTGGLAPAIEQLAQRATVPVKVGVSAERFPADVESTAYFVVSEALANVSKYSEAQAAEVSAERRNGALVLAVSDDGVGGANAGEGSGLAGLADRVAALDGTLSVKSPEGEGTRVTVELPLTESAP